jgi:Zn-dependent metalloprotease
MCHACYFIPPSVYRELGRDNSLSPALRRRFRTAARVDAQVRKMRASARTITAILNPNLQAFGVFTDPPVVLFDSHGSANLPGLPIATGSADPLVPKVSGRTNEVAKFFAEIFNRNSFDNLGSAMQSTLHFGMPAGQALWSGSQVLYSDGDGSLFLDPVDCDDLVGHEWTHAVTASTLQLAPTRTESGGLDESISDVFGSMFRQWLNGEDVVQADWRMGSSLLGPGSLSKGLKCVRDLADPGGPHCLIRQPPQFSGFVPAMQPHISSGIPNHAFYVGARAIGGRSWESIGQVWYAALTGSGAQRNMTMAQFAAQTRALAGSMFSAQASVVAGVDAGWTAVGL